jgi:predicted metal-dependent hydrolase
MIQSLFHIGSAAIPVKWRRNSKARRYILRFQRPACVIATIPRGGNQREALEFLQRSQVWLERQIAKPFIAKTHTWFRGERVPIEEFKIDEAQRLAFKELVQRTRELAAQTNSQITRITIRNQRSRWGSCSIRRSISLNWRLIQTPQFVIDYIILHELMHLREMNHSQKFWAEVQSVCPAWREAETWLKKHGREILH